jgi:hypothetical protein
VYGILHVVAGSYLGSSLESDYTSALYSSLSNPTGVYGDSAGNIFFIESDRNRIRKVSTDTGFTGELACPAGTYSNASTIASGRGCVLCGPGYFSSNTTSVECTLIPAGKVHIDIL